MKVLSDALLRVILCLYFLFVVSGLIVEGISECKSSDDQETQESRFETQGNDLASRLWSASLSNQSNMKRFRAIRTGLLQNMNITIHELYDAVDSGDMKEVRFQLKQINEKWKDIQDLHRAIIKLLSDDDTVGLQEETKLLVDNRDVLLRLNDQAEEFLAGKKNSTTSTISQVTSEIKSSVKSRPPSPQLDSHPIDAKAPAVPVSIQPSSIFRPKNITTTRPSTRTVVVTTTRASATFKPTTIKSTITTTPSTTTPVPFTQLDRYKNKREKLVEQMRSIIRTLEPAIESQNAKTKEEVRNLLNLIDDKIWPEIIKVSMKIHAEEEPGRRWRESLFQQDLKNTLARIHYKTGLRKCISADETYYQGHCQRFGATGVPCTNNQQLFDGRDNNGFCHCKYQDPTQPHNGLVYIDGQCYLQNVQGPCAIGQWIIVNDEGDPTCTPVPVGCGPPSKDGRKVFWTPDSKKPGSCAQLGSKQQCGILFRFGFQLFCGNHPNATIEQSPVSNLPPLAQQRCPRGFFVDQYNRCIRGIQL